MALPYSVALSWGRPLNHCSSCAWCMLQLL